MGLLNWVSSYFGDKETFKLNEVHFELTVEYFFKKLAVESCVDLISNTLSRCEFQTFNKGKETRGENYYLFNVSPNQNQNASEFIHSMVSHLIMENECLVIMQNNQLYIADSFNTIESALFENKYTDVTIGDFTFDKSFNESSVIHLKLNDRNIMQVIDSLYTSYGKLLSSAMNIYKRSNSKRFALKGDFLRSQSTEQQEAINQMFNNQMKAWLESDNAGSIFQLQEGYTLEDFSGNGKGGQSSTTSRDIRALVDDIFDYVAMAFHVPRGLLKGDLADVEKQTDNFLMFCINPIAELIADEFNRKMYSKEEYLERTYIKIDTSRIKVVDVVSLATALDKLFAIGANTINDNLRMLGREPIEHEKADQRFVTKNYQSLDNIDNLEGGEISNGNV
ncbi:phage portal protein [Schinkia azotoformans]|uniref:phage portal protein n=1 Tax=Schinkia azotoformans TaxID=1454 RepID=UPI002DBADD47|nr:phage portal protein [Schinkia azotoformans]MEC1778409.1 phage portal protein [Schinkia azotoformans]MED4328346.1 phage portal protein [Schinkia azotoformans]